MSHHREAILSLARAVRAAETERIAAGQRTLSLYDEGLHERSDAAVAYLKAVKAADDCYERKVCAALDEYAAAVNDEEAQRSQ